MADTEQHPTVWALISVARQRGYRHPLHQHDHDYLAGRIEWAEWSQAVQGESSMDEHDSYEDKITDERSLALRRESGRVNDERPMVCFLYLLMRGYMATGVVEESVRAVEDSKPNSPQQALERLMAYLNASGLAAADLTKIGAESMESDGASFTNGYLARYAQHLTNRLT